MPGQERRRHGTPAKRTATTRTAAQTQGKPVPPEVARQHIERLRDLLASK
jgi:hypothetical protein